MVRYLPQVFKIELMTSLLTIAICSALLVVVHLFGREMLTIVRARLPRGILEFKAKLREIEDDFWRR